MIAYVRDDINDPGEGIAATVAMGNDLFNFIPAGIGKGKGWISLSGGIASIKIPEPLIGQF